MKTPDYTHGRLSQSFAAICAVVAVCLLSGFIATPVIPKATIDDNVVHGIDSLIQQVAELNRQKQHQKAIELLISIHDAEGEDSFLRQLLLQTFDLFLQEEVYRGQIEIRGNNRDVKAYGRVAGALELLNDSSRAMEVLISGVAVNHKASDLWMHIARLELKAHRESEALDVYKEVIRIDKSNSDAYNNAAYLLAVSRKSDKSDLKKAEQFALKAQAIDPKNAEYLDTLAEVQFRQGNQKRALALIKEAIKLEPQKDALKNQLTRFRDNSFLIAE